MVGRSLLLFVLIGCHSVADGTQPITSEPSPSPVVAPAPDAAPGKLGAACTAGQKIERRGLDPCGSKGRIAIEMNPRQSLFTREVPCTPGSPYHHGAEEQTACVDGDRLYIRSACLPCRVPHTGWAAVVQLDELTLEGARGLQATLDLPTDPALTTTTAWRRALER